MDQKGLSQRELDLTERDWTRMDWTGNVWTGLEGTGPDWARAGGFLVQVSGSDQQVERERVTGDLFRSPKHQCLWGQLTPLPLHRGCPCTC